MYYYSFYDSETEETIALSEKWDWKLKCGDVVTLKGQRYKISGWRLDGGAEGFFVDKIEI